MSVHYKFKSALDFDTVTFDGLHISVIDLKKAIVHQKRLGKTADFDLQITNAQTKEEYTDDSSLIPKNTSLIIARIPLAVQPKKSWDPQADKVQGNIRSQPEPDSGTLDLSQMNGTEEDKIQAMMIQSTMDYDPNNYQKIRGQGQTGEVPANYRCYKCHKPGHWIKNCPLGSNNDTVDVKRNTGIPRSFIERDCQEKAAAAQQSQEQPAPVVAEKKQEIPEDLICSICKDLFTDAVMIPCCGSSFCDECVRTALLESEDNECPDCKEKGSSPGSLIPNRFLRNSVNAFRNETGYNKPRQKLNVPTKPKEVPPVEPTVIEESVENTSSNVTESDPKEKSISQKEDIEKIVKDKKEAEIPEKKFDAGTISSHDEIESDFEDNITVTVPPAHLQSQRTGYRERHYNGRHSRHLKPPGMDGSPRIDQFQSTPPHEERSCTPTIDEKDISSGHVPEHLHKRHPIPSHQPHPREPLIRPHRSAPAEMYGTAPPANSYPPAQPVMPPGRPYDMGGYGVHPPAGYVPYMMGDRMRGPFHPPRPGYPHMHQMRPRHMPPAGTLASVYQGVAAKVGTGIIDDPLEAFNRIMREKEKRKEERRRSPLDNRRRSRSIEHNVNRSRHSPIHHGRPTRLRTPDDRRLRSPSHRDRRGRSREKRSIDKDKRRHRSSSFSDRSSRSRSWSIPRKRTKSPMGRRRTRSRSPSFSVSRSRSRSISQGRFRGPPPPMRYNRSPQLRSISRYRQKENRRPDRRDEFIRDEFSGRSPPANYPARRGRSRGRMQSPQSQFFRQDRQTGPIGHGSDQYFHHQAQSQNVGGNGGYNDVQASYSQNNNNRYSRENHGPPQHRGEQYGRDRNDYKLERFDDGPPGTDEPPPPGFENTPQREQRNTWNHNQFDERSYRDDFRKQDSNNKKDYVDRQQTPDLREKPLLDHEDRRRHDSGRDREGRSWSRTSRHSSVNAHDFDNKRRRSRSKTPIRLERIQESYSGGSGGRGDHHSSKERYGNRERFENRDHQMHNSSGALMASGSHDRDKIDNDKRREREDRDRRINDHVSRDRNVDRKGHDRETMRHVSKEKERDRERDKDRERDRSDKDKDRDKEKEREKKRESSEDEKKDKKKDKEKRKKKKEKDQEKKKNKKERKEKEREKKEKEKTKEKEKIRDEEKDRKDHEECDDENEHQNERKFTLTENISEQSEIEQKMVDNSVENRNDEFHFKENNNNTHDNIHSSSMKEDEELNKLENRMQHEDDAKSQDADGIDLYADICQDEEIRYDYGNSVPERDNDDDDGISMKTQKERKASSPEIKRFDSVLDIHANLDFEPDLEDMESGEVKKSENSVLVPLPELSKWERDDDNVQPKEEKASSSLSSSVTLENNTPTDDKTGKVTNEVLKRAENAIFARAINAIRPIEIKKISVERQKLYSNETPKDVSPVSSILVKATSPKNELPTFQITVPANNNTSERSVELKSEKRSPIRSVKERLGSKITEPVQKRHKSRSTTPLRKIPLEPSSRIEKVRGTRSRSREQNYRGDGGNRDRDMRRTTSEIKRVNDQPNRSSDRDRSQKDFKMNDSGFNRNYDRNREYQQQHQQQQQYQQQHRGRDFDRRRDYGQDRRTWDQDKNRDRRRTPDKNNRDNRNRERFNTRGGNDDRDRDRNSNNYNINNSDNRSGNSGKERHKSKEPEKSRSDQLKRERSPSRSSDKSGKRDKRVKRDKESIKRKYSDDENSPNRDRKKHSELNKDNITTTTLLNDKTLQRKKSGIDEANFEPDYDEQPENDDGSHNNINSNTNINKNNSKNNNNNNISSSNNQKITEGKNRKDKSSKDKVKSPDINKRSRSSGSSSSSSSSDTDSGSDSDDNKKKKKRKHKKDKKRSRRSSSAESLNSTKHKRGKSKKKAKSSKKKKKSKK